MPTGYNQKCRIGWVYNDGSSNLIPFIARDRKVSPLTFQLLSNANFAGLPTLIDMFSLIPPIPVVFYPSGFNDTNSGDNAIGPVPDGYGFIIGTDNERSYGAARLLMPDAAARLLSPMHPVFTEYQGCYLVNDAGTFFSLVAVWEW